MLRQPVDDAPISKAQPQESGVLGDITRRQGIRSMSPQEHRDKYDVVAELALERHVRSVVDVGCRDGVLYHALTRRQETRVPDYVGVDLSPTAEGLPVTIADLSQGLPFSDASAELIAALDIVEHLDDFQAGLAELDRVAGRYLVVTLPNMAHFLFRARFLASGRISAKYDLAYGHGRDRHRWLTILPQTDAYMAEFCRRRGHRLHGIPLLHDGRRSGPVERFLARLRFPRSWYVWVTVYVIEKHVP